MPSTVKVINARKRYLKRESKGALKARARIQRKIPRFSTRLDGRKHILASSLAVVSHYARRLLPSSISSFVSIIRL
jgi:hypothetical protein